jgi:hypothetical protein
MASSDPSRKRGTEEVPPPLPAESKEVPPPPPAEPKEVPPPPPKEVKRMKPPRRKVPLPMHAPSVNVEDACFSVKMLYQAWQSLKKMAVHLGVQRPPEPLQTTVMDYTFKVNVLARHLEREVPPPAPTTTTMVASTSPAPAPTPTVGLLRRLLPLLNYFVLLLTCSSSVLVELVMD